MNKEHTRDYTSRNRSRDKIQSPCHNMDGGRIYGTRRGNNTQMDRSDSRDDKDSAHTSREGRFAWMDDPLPYPFSFALLHRHRSVRSGMVVSGKAHPLLFEAEW